MVELRKSGRGVISYTCAIALCWLGLAAVAAADEVTSMGTTLRGAVVALSSAGVTLSPEYGEGTIVIAWDDVEAITTDGDVMLLHGDDEEIVAPVTGVSGGAVIVGEREIDVTTIHSAYPMGDGGPTWRDRMNSSWRYWDGNFDVGFNLQQSTTDTTGLVIAFGTTRTKGPSRLFSAASYRFATEKAKNQEKSTIQDELKGSLRGEYDFTDRIYGFASGDAEYDAIERLSIRAVPKVGAGYTIFREVLDAKRTNFLRAEAGPGWVYQKYFGGDENEYITFGLGARAAYFLPYDSRFDWTFDYLPAVDDWADNYLIRTTGSLTVPMFDPVSAKLSLTDEYNNQPSPDTVRNSLFFTAGLSIGW